VADNRSRGLRAMALGCAIFLGGIAFVVVLILVASALTT
jgi:hypothetical protein